MARFWIRRRDARGQEMGLAFHEAETASAALLEFLAEQEIGQHDALLRVLGKLDISVGEVSGIARAKYGSCEFLAEPVNAPEQKAA